MKLEEVGRSNNPSLSFYAPAKFLKSHFEKMQYFAGYEQVARKQEMPSTPCHQVFGHYYFYCTLVRSFPQCLINCL